MAWARHYIERGWVPIPVPYREKAPSTVEWPNLRLRATELPDYFNGNPRGARVLRCVAGDLRDQVLAARVLDALGLNTFAGAPHA